MPISFHRSLCPFPTIDSARPVEDSLRHPYMATVAAGGSALPTIQRGLESIEREEAPVGTPPLVPVQEAVDALSPATRFLSLLHEELRTQRLRGLFNRPSPDHCSRIQIGRPQRLVAFANYSRVSHPDRPQHRPQRPRVGTSGTYLSRPFSILRRRMWVVRSGRRTRNQVFVYHN